MSGIGTPELLIVLAVALLLFGGAKLPQLARSLGEAKREFQKGVNEGNDNKSTATEATVKDAKPTNDA